VIYIGPAGVPISCEERTTLAGIECTAKLKLNAFECEFVRRVGMGNDMAKEVGELAKKLGVRLSAHCPYFINLCSPEKEKVKASQKRILDSVERAHFMGADVAVFHPGFYGKLSPQEALEAVKHACAEMADEMASKGIKDVKLGLETMGKQSTFGTVGEIIAVCKEVNGCVPVIDWAHLNCRYGGIFKTREDYGKIFDELKSLKLEHLHSHATCAEFTPAGPGAGNEKHHLTLDARKPDYAPLVQEILRRKISITLISESPILEQDAIVLKRIFEKHGCKF
jgi:deoxyribonuclease-4